MIHDLDSDRMDRNSGGMLYGGTAYDPVFRLSFSGKTSAEMRHPGGDTRLH